jgi:phage-related protein (TIGR01555 family)
MSGRLVNVRPKPGYLMDGAGEIIPARRNVVSFTGDKLSNVMSGQGTTIDRRMYAGYSFLPVEPVQAEAAYRGSWLMRKIIDIPPLDMTRAWRAWQTEGDEIEDLERLERRLQLREKCKRGLTMARLWGGGAIITGVKGQEADEPLDLDRVGKDSLSYLHVVSRHQFSLGQMITDPESEWYGYPEHYELTTSTSTTLRIHPSRVVPFVGQRAPEGSQLSAADWFWGDPLYQSLQQALINADLAQDGFAALIDEAKLDIIKIPGMMANVGTDEYETRLLRRLGLAQQGKSTWRALMIDGEEEWEQRQITWAGMPEIIGTYLQVVAGAADIPVTRLLGQSPKGLQSTGEGEEKDYHAMISARQDELLAPALDRIDEVLIRSALGNRPDDIWYTFNSLERLSPKDQAEIEYKRSQTVKTYVDTALFPDEALAEMAENALVEGGNWPGAEAAFEAARAAGLEPPEEGAEEELLTAEERAAKTAPVPAKDAAPRTLYVSRKVQNVADLKAWAAVQGLPELQDDLHVTIAFSRTAVDWIEMGSTWADYSGKGTGELVVTAGGPRVVEPLGDRTAVLMFASSDLSWRNREMREKGASWDWPDYQPHISLTAEPVDLANVEPYRGKIVLGPEIFEEIDEGRS